MCHEDSNTIVTLPEGRLIDYGRWGCIKVIFEGTPF